MRECGLVCASPTCGGAYATRVARRAAWRRAARRRHPSSAGGVLLAAAVVPLDEHAVEHADDRRQDRPRAERHVLQPRLQRLDVDLGVGTEVRAQRGEPHADGGADDHLQHRRPDRLCLPWRAAGHYADDRTDDRTRHVRERAGSPTEPQQAVADRASDDQSLDEPNDDAHGSGASFEQYTCSIAPLFPDARESVWALRHRRKAVRHQPVGRRHDGDRRERLQPRRHDVGELLTILVRRSAPRARA